MLALLPLALAAGVVHVAATTSDSPAQRGAACKPGAVRAVVGGRARCVRVGQRCERRHDRSYHRYRFHCHGPRLTRARQPAPPLPPTATPPPAPAPSPRARPEPPAGTVVFSGYPSTSAYRHYDGVVPSPKPVYPESPPVGGDHTEFWARCQVFTRVLDAGLTVHALEHGAVWLAYRPDLPDADLDVLRTFVDGDAEILASPYPGLTEAVVAVAWARQLRLPDVRDPRLAQFVDAYEDADHAPQAFIHTCHDPVG